MNILYPPFATDCEGAASVSDYIREGECNQPLHIVVVSSEVDLRQSCLSGHFWLLFQVESLSE